MDTANRIQLCTELKRDEGVRLKPYTDTTGHLTIGTGRNLTTLGISGEENDQLLQNDISRVEKALDTHLPWWRELDPVRQRVLMNMGFNCGIDTLLTFEKTLSLIQHRQYEAAADEMLRSRWAKQVGQRAQRLSRMMRRGHA